MSSRFIQVIENRRILVYPFWNNIPYMYNIQYVYTFHIYTYIPFWNDIPYIYTTFHIYTIFNIFVFFSLQSPINWCISCIYIFVIVFLHEFPINFLRSLFTFHLFVSFPILLISCFLLFIFTLMLMLFGKTFCMISIFPNFIRLAS